MAKLCHIFSKKDRRYIEKQSLFLRQAPFQKGRVSLGLFHFRSVFRRRDVLVPPVAESVPVDRLGEVGK